MRGLYIFSLAFYLSLVLVETMKASLKNKNLLMGACVGLGILLTHLVYGYHFLLGIMKKPRLKLRQVDTKTGNYLGG